MATRRTNPEGKANAATPNADAAAPADTAPAKDKGDGRITRLEKRVEDLFGLLHEHGIRHKAAEPAKEK